jgi:hypothetical protein
MADETPDNGGAESPGDGDTSLVTGRSPERPLVARVLALLGVVVLSLFWMALRNNSPAHLRVILDFMFNVFIGGLAAWVAFRALYFYSFRLGDLLAMVAGLSLGMHQTLELLKSLAAVGVFGEHAAIDDPRNLGLVILSCMIVGSALLAGAALGLRHCAVLKLEGAFVRASVVLAGLFALPAAAGLAAFPALILRDMLMPGRAYEHTAWFALLWLASIFFTAVNIICFIRTLTLNAQISAREHLAN